MGSDCSNLRHSSSRALHHRKIPSIVTKIVHKEKVMIRVWCFPVSAKIIDYEQLQNCKYFQGFLTPQQTLTIFDTEQGFMDQSIYQKLNYYAIAQQTSKSLQNIEFKWIKAQYGTLISLSKPQHFQLFKRIGKKQEILHQGEVIYMGEWAFKVKMILSGNDIIAMKNKFEEFRTKNIIDENVEEDLYCKFCYQKSGPHNPLIKPCKCQGSIQGIHRQCISQWILGNHLYSYKANIFSEGEKTFRLPLKKSRCQICHTVYEKFISYQILNRIYPVKPDQETYIVLESCRKKYLQQEDMPREYVCHVFNRSNKSLVVGRSASCSYSPESGSVSKVHASLSIKNSQLFIRDQCSKYGTFKKWSSETLKTEQGYQLGNLYFQLQQVQQTIHREYSPSFFPVSSSKSASKPKLKRRQKSIQKKSNIISS